MTVFNLKKEVELIAEKLQTFGVQNLIFSPKKVLTAFWGENSLYWMHHSLKGYFEKSCGVRLPSCQIAYFLTSGNLLVVVLLEYNV